MSGTCPVSRKVLISCFGIWVWNEGGVWGLGFGVWGLGFGVWGVGFRQADSRSARDQLDLGGDVKRKEVGLGKVCFRGVSNR